MAILDILRYPDARLYTVAEPVRSVDESIRKLVTDLAETMYAAPGIGLAATQVDVHKRVIVIDMSESRKELLVLINPEIVGSSGVQTYEEGCLSVPGIYEKLERAESIEVQALGLDGQPFRRSASGLLAVCIQHEMDHLLGRVFVQYLSRLKQQRIRSKLLKQERRSLATV